MKMHQDSFVRATMMMVSFQHAMRGASHIEKTPYYRARYSKANSHKLLMLRGFS
jgi:hypothetical protein